MNEALRHGQLPINLRYVADGVRTGGPDRPYAHLPQYAAPRVHCTAFV
jgi:hypothetical protein